MTTAYERDGTFFHFGAQPVVGNAALLETAARVARLQPSITEPFGSAPRSSTMLARVLRRRFPKDGYQIAERCHARIGQVEHTLAERSS